ncbi:MAG: adenylate/guanylate cyclase domain-containing protein [Chloroflexia bacterium]
MKAGEPTVELRPRPRLAYWLGIRAKIILPYVFLAIAVALAGAYVVTQLIVESVQQRFLQQLQESARLVADRMVGIEQENLAVLRSLAHTEGLAEAVERGDRRTLDQLAYPIAVNGGAEVVDILDRSGTPVLALHHRPGGGPADYERTLTDVDWNRYPFVRRVLRGESDARGDKFSGLAEVPWGITIYVAGPIFREDIFVGVLLVGRRLEGLPDDLRRASASHHVTLYAPDGTPLATTFLSGELTSLRLEPQQAESVLSQGQTWFLRRLASGGRTYDEALGRWEVRGEETIGLFGAALAESYLVQASPITQAQVILLVAAFFLAVIFLGMLVAQRISRPILQVAQAARRVASGNLEQRVDIRTRDEVEEMAQAFNKMLDELKQAQRVRDIFGRAVSPEVSRLLIEATERGEVALGGETRVVSILFADIRGFTALSEGRPPEEVLATLNQVLGKLIAVIGEYNGVVNKFGGDSLLAIFGAPIPQPDHARRAVMAGLEMVQQMAALNEQRRSRGQGPLSVGITINTGLVVAGLTGSAERLEYTVIGDTVNVAARLQELAGHEQGPSLLITASTAQALGSEHGLEWVDLGMQRLRGRVEPVRVYAVRGLAGTGSGGQGWTRT